MEPQGLKKQWCTQLGSCLEYPVNDSRETLQSLIQQIASVRDPACIYLKEFLSQMETMELSKRQEYYVQSFDLTPHCSLYLSVHLFGEESFKRSELMVGLKGAYEKHGAIPITELPDHLAVVLKQNALLSEEEWSEIVSMCILPVLPKMIVKLERFNNPYALVLKAVQALLMGMEKVHV